MNPPKQQFDPGKSLVAINSAIPSTFYATLSPQERVQILVDDWRRKTVALEAATKALQPLADIAHRWADNGLHQSRPAWGAKEADAGAVELLHGTGGTLLTLQMALDAATALGQVVIPKTEEEP